MLAWSLICMTDEDKARLLAARDVHIAALKGDSRTE